jgi:RNA polymerase sigma-70 factor (ECF subfamily)
MSEDLEPADPHDAPPELGESVDLVRRAQDGDRDALAALVLRYQDRVRRLVRIRMGPKFVGVLDSVDLAQETWLAALRGLQGFRLRDHSSIIAWLARIAENQVLDAADRLNTAKRDRRREVPLSGDHSGAGPARDGSPSEEASRRELKTIYDACVAELPPEWREVVLLREYSLAEWPAICAQLGSPNVHATKQLYRRAQLRLGALLKERLKA